MNGTADKPGVIAPPPLILLALILLGLALDRLWPAPFAATWARLWLGGALILLGLALVIAVFRRFRRAGTNIETRHPTTALVTDGLYRFSRNPVYLGFALAQLGAALAANSLWLAALLPVLLIALGHGVVAREERYLEAKFGQAYLDYKARVRRWL